MRGQARGRADLRAGRRNSMGQEPPGPAKAIACEAAKISPAVTLHELRHTYASTLAQRGVDLLTISKLLGHADVRISARHYAPLCDATLKAAVDKLPALGIQANEGNAEAIR